MTTVRASDAPPADTPPAAAPPGDIANPSAARNPAPSRGFKLHSVSMRSGPPELHARLAANAPPPRLAIHGTPPDGQPLPSVPAQQAAADPTPRPQPANRDWPAFTSWQRPREAAAVGPSVDPSSLPILPRTRYRPEAGQADQLGIDPPPIPAVAQRLRRRLPGGAPGPTRALTPFQAMDQAVRLRLWQPFVTRRPKPPPSSG